jgi:RHS repeat-associated protein
MTTKNGSISYGYDPNHKHAVSSISAGGSYTYDANGNMITRIEGGLTYTQVFDAENRLVSVTMSGQTTQFLYDGDGNLVKKVNPDASRTLYVGGIYEVDKDPSGVVINKKTYYPGACALNVNGTLYYMLHDHLGSTTIVTTALGNIAGNQYYYPFGETRYARGTMNTDKLYTGQRQMAGLGIYYYNARFYSPYINRFLSADSIVPGYANPQALNRYSYVLNNPLLYTDPTGHRPDDGYVGNHSNHFDCKKYPQYCNNGKKKSDKELQAMSPKPQPKKVTPINLQVTIPTTTATLPINGTPLPQQCTSGYPCVENFVPSATPTATSTPYNVLATAGANLDIAANTAVVGSWNYCTGGNAEPPCGKSVQNMYPPSAPWAEVFDAGVGTGHFIDNLAENSSQSAPKSLQIANYVIAGVSIPTAVVPLLIFFFAP